MEPHEQSEWGSNRKIAEPSTHSIDGCFRQLDGNEIMPGEA